MSNKNNYNNDMENSSRNCKNMDQQNNSQNNSQNSSKNSSQNSSQNKSELQALYWAHPIIQKKTAVINGGLCLYYRVRPVKGLKFGG